MLKLPKQSSGIFNIVGIDPGTDTLGYAKIAVSVPDLNIVNTEAFTLSGSKLMNDETWIESLHGARLMRLRALESKLIRLLRSDLPLVVAAEAPFYSRRQPTAYGPLIETISMLRNAVMRFDRWTPLTFNEPRVIKQAVGVVGKIPKGKAKEVVRDRVLVLKELKYCGNIPIHRLDEHSIDAIAIAYAQLLAMRSGQ